MRHLLIITLAFLLTPPLSGQTIDLDTPPGERAAYVTQRMKEGLQLEATQIDTVHALNLKYARRVQAEIIDPGLNKVSAYFRMRSINREKEAELLPLLREAQKKRYEVLKKKTRKEMIARFF